MILRTVLILACTLSLPATRAQAPLLTEKPAPTDFALARPGHVAPLVVETSNDRAVRRAAADLQADLERVTGQRPALLDSLPAPARTCVLVGTLGQSSLIDRLVADQRIDATNLPGAWESFVIQAVSAPWPGVDQALVIVGSDRRGTIYGIYELAQAIGVSPWHWWADVPPPRRESLHVSAEASRFGPPSVRYRGIFINDEDWALQPWAARTHEPETGDIGPKTYARVFELLLRLKANLLWPAMHPSTKPFNHFPENKDLADAYGVIMGSSHAEPMLRNNVGEWRAPAAEYNYVANRDGVLGYWAERIRENGRYENVYTLGMRGIHDSNMVGPRTNEERIATLERIFADQRALLREHAREGEAAPQMFCAYKEVLDLYRAGLKVPEDVTIVWPDDNFGYIRNFATAEERTRSGGFGVYYHASYLGRPLAYLWLNTMPPGLIWSEMHKAYEHGADRMWILNVGDIKPAEIATEFFLQMAWDIGRWRSDNLGGFLAEWARREFGESTAPAVASIMAEYYRLNFIRKPEHLQWWLANETPRPSPLTADEIEQRVTDFRRLAADVARIEQTLSPERQDAFFQLVTYPVLGAAAANQRYFHAEAYGRWFDYDLVLARQHATLARDADDRLHELTRRFNEDIAGGKWRHFMTLEPADNQWRSMRVAPLPLPAANQTVPVSDSDPLPFGRPTRRSERQIISPLKFSRNFPGRNGSWRPVDGFARLGPIMTVLPTTFDAIDPAAIGDAPQLEYVIELPSAGTYRLTVSALPTHPVVSGQFTRLAVAVNGAAPQVLQVSTRDGTPEWAQGVLHNAIFASMEFESASGGVTRIRIHALDPGVAFDALLLEPIARAVEPKM
jgi:hypothetical protein